MWILKLFKVRQKGGETAQQECLSPSEVNADFTARGDGGRRVDGSHFHPSGCSSRNNRIAAGLFPPMWLRSLLAFLSLQRLLVTLSKQIKGHMIRRGRTLGPFQPPGPAAKQHAGTERTQRSCEKRKRRECFGFFVFFLAAAIQEGKKKEPPQRVVSR